MKDGGTVAILLAAGRGSRFDASGARNKLLAPLGNATPLAVQAARNLLACRPPLVAVVAVVAEPDLPGNELASALAAAGCVVTHCPTAHEGMAASLIHGIHYAEQQYAPQGFLLALADMPGIAPTTIGALVQAGNPEHSICAPYWQGQRGHPVWFARSHLPALCALTGDMGARALLQAHPHTRVEVEDSGILQDVDTEQDWLSAQLRQ
jgi:molybdenum cofactor cytidylyltransferase